MDRWLEYQRKRRELEAANLSPEEYERRIKELAESLNL